MSRRIVIVGKSGFLAQHIVASAHARGLSTETARLDADLDVVLDGADAVVNCALHPDFHTMPYDPGRDFDATVAQAAAKAGAAFAMLSSRRVYPAPWGALETDPAGGDSTFYGDNKARSEAAVRASRARWTIFRMANIFGDEFGRPSFMGRLSTSLATTGTIHFDMSPATRRDFLPVEIAAAAIINRLMSEVDGIYNLGCGTGVACGDLVEWVMEGFGSGRLDVSNRTIRDEFFLNMEKTGVICGVDAIRERCLAIGQRLKCRTS